MANEEQTCQICGAETSDIRHLGIECGYEVSEVSDKFEKVSILSFGFNLYRIRVCKGCRSVFLFDFLANFIKYGKAFRLAQNIDEEGISFFVPNRQ